MDESMRFACGRWVPVTLSPADGYCWLRGETKLLSRCYAALNLVLNGIIVLELLSIWSPLA